MEPGCPIKYDRHLLRFQSLKGLQPKWNHYLAIANRGTAGFQSLKGLQPKWNGPTLRARLVPIGFQSLKGLQPKWNAFSHAVKSSICSVSIPKRVTAKVELKLQLFWCDRSTFQSLKGLQPKWNAIIGAIVLRTSPFQSLKGLQPKWNRSLS